MTSKPNTVQYDQIPDRAPQLDITVTKIELNGKIEAKIRSLENGKITTRTFESMLEAEKLALFIASTVGVKTNDLNIALSWLNERGFSGVSIDRLKEKIESDDLEFNTIPKKIKND